MIIYKTNENWIGDIWHLAKSWTMVKVVRGVFGFGAFTAIVCLIHWKLFPYAEENGILTSFSLIGVVLSILLVFRTNNSYDRWWEGRKQWGALVNNTRNMAVYAHTMLKDDNLVDRQLLAKKISNFCHAMVEHLREGTDIKKLHELSGEEILAYGKVNHIPNAISNEIYEIIRAAYKRGEITDADLINFGPLHKSLLDIIGACERIKKTPIPFSYAVFLKIFITTYGVLLPFALAPMMGFYAIPVVMLAMFAFIGIELMGQEIEDPFGLDCNDLPTGTIASTIQENVYEIFELNEEKTDKEKPELYTKVF